MDLLIASTCVYCDLALPTDKRRHYEMVEGLKTVDLSSAKSRRTKTAGFFLRVEIEAHTLFPTQPTS
jgi:hypothetical protein